MFSWAVPRQYCPSTMPLSFPWSTSKSSAKEENEASVNTENANPRIFSKSYSFSIFFCSTGAFKQKKNFVAIYLKSASLLLWCSWIYIFQTMNVMEFFHKIWEKVMFLYFLMNTNWNLYYAVILDRGEDPNLCWGDLSKTEGNGAWRKASLRLPFPSRTCFATVRVNFSFGKTAGSWHCIPCLFLNAIIFFYWRLYSSIIKKKKGCPIWTALIYLGFTKLI